MSIASRTFALVALGSSLACVTALDEPDPTQVVVRCSTDEDCPGSLRCNTTQSRCVDGSSSDFEPPSITRAEINPPRVGAGGSATLSLEFDEPLQAAPRVTFVRDGATVAFSTDEPAGRSEYSLSYQTTSDDEEGAIALTVEASDPSGNRLTQALDEPLVFDFTPPARVGTVRVEPERGSTNLARAYRPSALALGDDGVVTVSFRVSESLSVLPTIELGGPNDLVPVLVEDLFPLYVATFLTTDSSASAGSYIDLQIELIDLAGNSSTESVDLVSLAQSFQVDFSAPSAPNVDSERITLVRAPWGSIASGGAPQTELVGSAGSIEPNATVLAYRDTDVSAAQYIASVESDATGAFVLPFAVSGLTRVAIRLGDAAGNISSAQGVRNIEFYANTATADVPFNPNAFFEQALATGLPVSDSERRVDEARINSPGDEQLLSTVAAGYWLTRLPVEEPPWRYGGLMVTDTNRGELSFFGGTVEGSGATCDELGTTCRDLYVRAFDEWVFAPSGVAPGLDLPDFDHFVATYDAGRARITGYEYERGRLWELNDGAWRFHSEASLEESGPRRFSAPLFAYDGNRGQLILFGGRGCPFSNYCDETWSWDGEWRQLNPATSPPGRADGVMVFDSVRNLLVMTNGFADVGSGSGLPCGSGTFSDSNGFCFYSDTWEFDGQDWDQRCEGTPASDTCSTTPFPVELASAAFDPPSGRIYVYGGRNRSPGCGSDGDSGAEGCVYGTMQWWDGVDWQRQDFDAGGPSASTPSRTFGAHIGFDPATNRIVLKSGLRSSSTPPMGSRLNTYAWSGEEWRIERVYTAAQPERPRNNFAYGRTSSAANEIFLFGGEDFDDESCGGEPGNIQCDDGFRWGPSLGSTGWEATGCDSGSDCPNAVGGMRMAFDPGLSALVAVGGNAEGSCDGFSDDYCSLTWTLDISVDSSNFNPYTVTQLQRRGHALAEPGPEVNPGNTVCDGNGVFFFGGNRSSTYFNDLREFQNVNPGLGGWNTICTESGGCASPSPRTEVEMVCDPVRDELILFGGELPTGEDCGEGSRYCSDTWRFDGNEWSQVIPEDPEGDGNPVPRSGHRMTWDADRNAILLHGGFRRFSESPANCLDGTFGVNNECHYADLWEWTGRSWAKVPVLEDSRSEGSPGGRSFHGLQYLSSLQESLVFGGDSNVGDRYETWFWQNATQSRPRHVFRVDLNAPGLAPSALEDVEVVWSVGGTSADEDCENVGGARLLVLRNGFFSGVIENQSDVEEPSNLSWRFGEDGEFGESGLSLRKQLRTADNEIVFGVEPLGNTGCAPRRGQITTDYVEVRLDYRLDP